MLFRSQHAQVHAHVDEGLEADPDADALAHEAGKDAVQRDGLMCQGIGIWIGFQAFINMGVNLGVLPTKGLTLPLMSYGGSAILMNLIAMALVLRVDIENRALMRGGRT